MSDNTKAIDAIWKTELNDSNEKLVLYHLTSKHQLGERYSSSWKSLATFMSDFSLQWCSVKDIQEGTRLSDVKVHRTLESLKSQGLVELSEREIRVGKKKAKTATERLYAINLKIFENYQAHSSTQEKASA